MLHSYQTASFAHGFLEAHLMSWDLRLTALEDDLPPLFDALAHSGYRAEPEVVTHPPKPGGASYEYHGVNLVLSPTSGKGKRFVLPGDPGTSPSTTYACSGPPRGRPASTPR